MNKTTVMNKRVYAVKDVKANTIGPLVMVNTEVEMFRSLKVAVEDKSSLLGRYPEDFVLLYLGEINMDGDMSMGSNILNPYRVGVVSDILGVE